MTFSDQAVVDFLGANFVPAWESVAPVKVVEFDLGNGKSVTGTISGEIALWFCRPDGTVFDILPGLHAPAVTLQAAREALAFYERTGATDEAILAWHAERLAALPEPVMQLADLSHKQKLARRRGEGDPATADLATMAFSKTISISTEAIVVVEPGGLALYRREVHQMLLDPGPWRTPHDWQAYLFEDVLEQPLEGGHVTYDSSSLAPISIIED